MSGEPLDYCIYVCVWFYDVLCSKICVEAVLVNRDVRYYWCTVGTKMYNIDGTSFLWLHLQ